VANPTVISNGPTFGRAGQALIDFPVVPARDSPGSNRRGHRPLASRLRKSGRKRRPGSISGSCTANARSATVRSQRPSGDGTPRRHRCRFALSNRRAPGGQGRRTVVTRILLLLTLGFALAWVGGRLFGGSSGAGDGERAPALAVFGPYKEEMCLRGAFASLTAAAGPTALALLQDNPDAWVARWRMLERTRESLDVSYFILREDLFGAAFLGALL